MTSPIRRVSTAALAATSLAALASAGNVVVNSNIVGNVVWTADNCYELQADVYIEPGSTLTIEAGTVIASGDIFDNSLTVTRGAQLFINGTRSNPVIFTSQNDVATWDVDASHPSGGNPQTGTWRATAAEWGNLNILGNGYISSSGGDCEANVTNVEQMEGLTDPVFSLYGGANDGDDSGDINYVSLRYGGRVQADAVELNGLSMGGVGNGTDISYIEIMNNIDDGIEIWGGTVNIDHVTIWNIGDDSFDLDQGWRGSAQFGLIVQGYSLINNNQGSGFGDNIFEIDGAESSLNHPRVNTVLYNFTSIGNPLDGDFGADLSENARVQWRQSIFMDVGDDLVTDGGNYDEPGLDFATTWTTAFSADNVTGCNGNDQAFLYGDTQKEGNLLQIYDSVIFNSPLSGDAAVDAEIQNVANNNVVLPASSPIVSITRDVTLQNPQFKDVENVIGIDPRAANDAVVAADTASQTLYNGRFESVGYRGAFGPNAGDNWLCGWTAADAYGFVESPATSSLRSDPLGNNPDSYTVTSEAVIGGTFTATVDVGSTGNALAFLVGYGGGPFTLPFSGRTILVNVLDPGGELTGGPSAAGPIANINVAIPSDLSLCGVALSTQAIHFGGSPYVLSNAQDLVVGNQ